MTQSTLYEIWTFFEGNVNKCKKRKSEKIYRYENTKINSASDFFSERRFPTDAML